MDKAKRTVIKKPEQVEEVVWTGTSDRTAQRGSEFFEPDKSSQGKTVYKVAREAGPATSKRAKPLYSEGQETARIPVPPPPSTAPTQTLTARDKGRVIAQTVVGSFVDRMKAEATRKGGRLSLDDISALDEEFGKKTAALEVLFEKTFEEYAQSYANGAAEERRANPFDRLIVGPFEQLLTGAPGPSAAKGGISRRIMPGFFMAMSMMLGPESMTDFHNRAEAIFDHRSKTRGEIDWPAFFSEAKDLRLDVLIAMAVHFSKPDKRAAWFLDMINNHLSPPESDPETDAVWTLSKYSYERLIDVMFSDLMTAVGSPKARETITKRFGPETCASVAAIMKGLGA